MPEAQLAAGGAGGAASGAAGGGGGGSSPCDLADGPYGIHGLRFGALEPYAAFQSGEREGSLSPTGLRFIQNNAAFSLREYTRGSLTDESWAMSTWTVAYFDVQVRYANEDLGLFACHGGEQKCGFYWRASTDVPFGYDNDFAFLSLPPFDVLISGGGAADFAFTTTPDGRFLAFSSNRLSALEDVPAGPLPDGMELWTAEPNNPANPEASYKALVAQTLASSPSSQDLPRWFSDDALAIVLASKMPGEASRDVYLASRSSTAGPFDAPERILSVPSADEDGFTMPSLETIVAHGNRGYGYLRRGLDPAMTWYRFEVCVGVPAP
ncbi:MAG: hypothetical protein HY908_17665 [Myxococcales bacterium]|nr:hypothetical protein [Myxococcales bacterium]